MHRILCLIAISLLLLTCKKDERRVLFDMVYPNILFDIPAGLSGSLPQVLSLDDLRTNFKTYLRDNNIDEAMMKGIEPTVANFRALDNSDLDFLQEVSIRICGVDKTGCTASDEVFYLDDIPFRRGVGDELRLLPTLINADRILKNERFRLEVWLFLYGISPTTIPVKLDLQFEVLSE